MVAQLLLQKILQLFIIMILGFVLVKVKIVKSEDSKVLSKLSLYLFMPASIIKAFNIQLTKNIVSGLLMAFSVAIIIHLMLMVLDFILKKYFKTTNVERASIMYSNAGSLIFALVTYILGDEWLIYSSGYLIVQIVFLWTHGVGLFSDEKINLKKILLNVNLIAVAAGFIIMLSGIKLPNIICEVTSSLGAMLAPAGMIIAGMLAASVDFKKMLKFKRLYFVLLMRLVVCPVVIMLLLKGVLLFVKIPYIETIMVISYLASITPSASTVMQFAQIYGKDSSYATAINAVTTVGCIITMPLLIMMF